ncbi:Cytochrome B561 [Polaromonas sp. CG9_12]|uniref:cytochrome b n=1 Tax=Polaromonas sp. CG_9.11 TaxID=2787730 RepID=UPI0004DDDAAE|nr:cytochrome b/b6 domain-containing protein [Polaromonas sp. CG_9.11]MBG6076505.1 cytochrome b561 [Polaromonas sp. CG_9.11]CDS50041.1 Cytochrome B561 [Polaromonas sp. CG9_12]
MRKRTSIATVSSKPYASLAVLLHWTLAVLIIGMVALGWYMTEIEDDPGSAWFFTLHKSIGLVIAGLVLLRLVWRLGHLPEPLPARLPSWQVNASRATHGLLYAAMLAMPTFGIVGSLLSKKGIVFFGLPLPRVFQANHDLAETFFNAHSFTTWILVVLVSLHVLAGLKHLVIDKDGVFQRMWFSR